MTILVAACTWSSSQTAAGTQEGGPPNGTRTSARHVPAGDELAAIGTRKIGRTGAGNWYSLEKEQTLGRRYAQALEQKVKLTKDPTVTEYINRIAQSIVRNSDAQVPFRVKVIESDEISAFALPGGYLYVNTGLILAVRDEAELAGVMAHEIAHVAAHHAVRQTTRSNMFDLASLPIILLGGPVGVAVQATMGFAKPLSLTKFSRGFEAEADYLGVQYLYKAGYDPQALVSFFERVRAMEHHQPGPAAKALSSHPQTSDRVDKLQKELATVLPPRDAYVVSTSDFDQVVERLLCSGGTVRLQTEPRPRLRRRPAESPPSETTDAPLTQP